MTIISSGSIFYFSNHATRFGCFRRNINGEGNENIRENKPFICKTWLTKMETEMSTLPILIMGVFYILAETEIYVEIYVQVI
jgi:hypothetical protein